MAGVEATQAAQEAERREAKALLTELGTAAGQDDPYPVYTRLRELAPVCLASASTAFLTTYDHCLAVIRDTKLHAQNAEWMDTVRADWRDHPGLRVTHESFVFRDPPDHTRLRRPVSGPFTHRQAEAIGGYIRDRIDRVLDTIAEGGADGGEVDLHELLATSLPIAVISKVLGVPEADQAMLRKPLEGLRLAVDGSSRTDLLPVIDEAAVALLAYFADLVAARRAHPRDDLTSELVAMLDAGAQVDGEPAMTGEELLQTLTLIFSAAIESMVDLLLNGTAALLANPDQAGALRRDPGLAASATEEALRYDAPVQMIGRVPVEDYTIGDVTIPAGGYILAVLGAGNRDPAKFTDPSTFDITRAGASPLSFSGGVHHCLGAPLARVQATMFFPALLNRFPGLHLAGPLVRRGNVLRGFAHFPIAIR
ncbi:MAG TPA: cytochrome P450 [Streptosporangiaceae bacterium]|jgi:cytochrome P450